MATSTIFLSDAEWHAELAALANSIRARQRDELRQSAVSYVETERKRRWAA